MPISGKQPALTEARVGMMRLGGSRLGYVLPIPYVTINGVVRTNDVRIEGASIRDILNGTPNTATMRVDGSAPTEGQEVVLNFGVSGPTQFRGRILSTTKIYETGNPQNLAWDCSCISEEWLLNRRKVTKRYLSTSATAIILDLIATYTSGFTTTGVASGLPTLDEITFTSEDVTTCLDRICQRIGEDWQLDYAKVLHVPAADGQSVHPITDSDDHGMSGIAVTTDLSQLKTRQSGEGGGSNTSTDIAVGQTTMPLDDTTWYNPAGGTVKSGPQFITYTGKSTIDGTGSKVGGKTGLAPGIPTAAVVSGTPGNLAAGDYRYVAAFEINGGVTEVGNNSSAVTIAAVSAPSAPSVAVVANTPGNLPAASYDYGVTYVTVAGETTSSSSANTSIQHVTAPSADPSAAGTTGGSIPSSTQHTWYVTYVTAAGETPLAGSFVTFTLGVSDTAVSLTSIPVSGDGRVIGRRIYREDVGDGGPVNAGRVADITNNTATTFTDTLAGDARGVRAPSFNTSGTGQITVTIPVSSDGRVTKRIIYRTEGGGSTRKKLATVNNNTDTAYTDNIGDASLGVEAPIVNTSGSGRIDVSNIPIGPAGTTARKLYRSPVDVVSIADYRFLATIANNSTTTHTDNTADSGLGAQAPSSTVGPVAGETSIVVQDLSAFASGGGWVRMAGQLIRFTGRSGSSGAGTLTGVPASGIGAITAAVPYDTPVLNAPHLTGVSGVLYAINQGEPVNLWVTRNDTAAQTFMAAAVGGDGIHEADLIQDRRKSETEITASCDAKLEELTPPLVTVRYQTRDVTTKSGRTVSVTLSAPTSISGTFKIQSVTTSGFSANGEHRPLYQVECSSRLLTFEQVLRIRKAN